jgi:hypothetical protein
MAIPISANFCNILLPARQKLRDIDSCHIALLEPWRHVWHGLMAGSLCLEAFVTVLVSNT